MSTQQTYRVTRQYGKYAAGAEVSLTEDAAIRLNNEAPGLLERIEPAPKAEPPRAKPVVKGDL